MTRNMLAADGKRCAAHQSSVAVAATALALLVTAAWAVAAVVDQTGAVVDLPAPPARVLSAYGPATYYVYALGEGDRIVAARYVALTGPEGEVGALHRQLDPQFGDKIMRTDPTIEEVVAQRPDLVITNPQRNPGMAEVLGDLRIPAAQYVPETVDDVVHAVRLTGALLGPPVDARAEALAADLEGYLTDLGRAVGGLAPGERPRVLFVGTAPLRVASGAMLQSELIARAGGLSVTARLAGGWRDISLEQLVAWDPEVIVIAPYGGVQPADLLEDPQWAWIGAVQSDRVYKMPRVAAPWDAPVPDAVLGALWLAQVLHPHLAPHNAAAEALILYEEYYGITLARDVLERLRAP